MALAPTHFPADLAPDDVADHIRRDGYAIVDDLADGDVLDRLDTEAAPLIASSAAGRDGYDGRHTRRTGALVARCPASRELIMHPTIVATVERFLDHASAVQLHLTQIISIEPGETAQQLHRDQMAFDFYPFPPTYHVQLNTMWALTDFTAANGATVIRPGTSGMSDDDAGTVEPIQAEMGRGIRSTAMTFRQRDEHRPGTASSRPRDRPDE